MGIARIGGMVAMAAALWAGMAEAADIAVRVKNDTRGVVIARIQAEGKDWTDWSEELPFDAVKNYRHAGVSDAFFIELRYDDGREWRHVCTKSIMPAGSFTLTATGAVPHMRCVVTPLGTSRPAVAAARQTRTVHHAAVRPAVRRRAPTMATATTEQTSVPTQSPATAQAQRTPRRTGTAVHADHLGRRTTYIVRHARNTTRGSPQRGAATPIPVNADRRPLDRCGLPLSYYRSSDPREREEAAASRMLSSTAACDNVRADRASGVLSRLP